MRYEFGYAKLTAVESAIEIGSLSDTNADCRTRVEREQCPIELLIRSTPARDHGVGRVRLCAPSRLWR